MAFMVWCVFDTPQRYLNDCCHHSSKQSHPLVVLFVLGKGIGFAPAFEFQVGNDVLAGGFGGFIAPQSPHFRDAGQMMPLLAVAHSVGRLAGIFVQPLMHLGVGFAKSLLRLGAMLFKGRHT
jgi:hypothetical protein